MKKALIAIIGFGLFLALILGGAYNGLVTQSQNIDAQWAQVETQYQRRFDLIPNLVKSVEGIMKQEQAVFTALAEARTRYGGAGSVDEKVQAATQVESALSRLLVIVENYPEIKSSEQVTALMDELAGTENRIAVERRRYNDFVRDYNTAVSKVPTKFIAGMFGFTPRSYFEAVSEAATAPAVDINP